MSQAEHATTTRRSLLADLVALSSTAVASGVLVAQGVALADPSTAATHADAELLALEAPIVALAATADRLFPQLLEFDRAAEAAAAPRPDYHSREWPAFVDRHNAALETLGYYPVNDAWERADRELLNAVRAIERIPARTFDGLRMKARMCEHGDADLVQSIVDDLIAIDKAMRA